MGVVGVSLKDITPIQNKMIGTSRPFRILIKPFCLISQILYILYCQTVAHTPTFQSIHKHDKDDSLLALPNQATPSDLF